MNKLLAVYKVVAATALGMSGFAFMALLALRLVMRDSLPHRAAEWLFIMVLVVAAGFVAGGLGLLLIGAWREESAEHLFQPLTNQHQRRFLIESPSSGQYGIVDVEAEAITGLIIGRNGGAALTMTPIAYDMERVANGRVPYPEPEHAGSITDAFFRGQ